MKVIKRNGETELFDKIKIEIAIRKANYESDFSISEEDVLDVANKVEQHLRDGEPPTVENIQSLVVMELNKISPDLASDYQDYRELRTKIRHDGNTTDESIMSLVDGLNEEVQKENSNKDPILNSTQRDLIAGEVSKDITRRMILPRHIVKAHENGIIHEHK